MKRRRTIPGPSAALLAACALLVSLAQPLAALATWDACASCGHGELEATCCCAPEESPAPLPDETLSSCCSETPVEPTGAELASEHECCCNSVPDGPTVPAQLPPVQDIAAAGHASRLVAAGQAVSARTVLGFGGAPRAPDGSGGLQPPATEHDNETRLGRAAVRGTSTLLALLSVARL